MLHCAGFTRGQLQHIQLDVSKVAAMAGLLAEKAGWWQLEVMLSLLAQQAAAGVKPELLPLMQVGSWHTSWPSSSSSSHTCNVTSRPRDSTD